MGLPESVTGDFHPALEPLGGGHRDGAHPVVTQMLLHLKGELHRGAGHGEFHRASVVDCRNLAGKLNVHNGSDNLNDFTCIHLI